MSAATNTVNTLVDRVKLLLTQSDSNKSRILITIAGAPGAGKTTISTAVAQKLTEQGTPTVVVGMDGYHYTRKDLVKLIGEEKATKFRGAPYTFDAQQVVNLATQLKHSDSDVYFNTFDHAIKDPVLNAGKVPKDIKVVLFEGNYLHLKEAPWNKIIPLTDDSWFIDIDPKVAAQRLAKRHLAAGLVSTLEEGELRANSNDIPNGLYITQNSTQAKFVCKSE